MKDLFGIDDIDWSNYETAYGGASTIPNMIKKLLTSNKKIFNDTMGAIYAHLCHQGTIYGGTVKAVPFFWKVLQYHISEQQYEFAREIFSFLEDIYKPDEWYIEPFGVEFKYHVKKFPDSILIDIEKEMFKPWDLILEFYESESEWLRNQAIFFLRYNLSKAEESVKKLRKNIPKERNEVILVNSLKALVLLDAHLGIDSDLQLFINFLHPVYPRKIRLVALLGFFILKKGNVPDSFAQIIINFINNIEDDHGPKTHFYLSPEPNLDKFEIDNPNNSLKDIFKEITSTISAISNHFYELDQSKVVLYFVRPGTNKLLIPILLDIFSKIPERMEKPELASINIAETLLTLLFPDGFTRTLKASEKLNDHQVIFIRKLIDTKKWDFKLFSEQLAEYGLGKSKEEFLKLLTEYPHIRYFNESFILHKLKAQSTYFEHKLDQEGNIIELNGEYFPEEIILEVIGDLKHLKKLKLSPSSSKRYIGISNKLKTLDTLELNPWGFNNFPKFVEKLTSLKSLIITSHSSEEFNSPLQSLKSLRSLRLILHSQKEIPEFVKHLSSLTSLELNIGEIEVFPEIFKSLKNLEYLRLWQIEGLKSLPDSICELSKLRELYLGGTLNEKGGLDTLPARIGDLKNLKKFDIDYLNLIVLPDSIGGLESLEHFKCHSATLETLPESFGKLKNLKKLEIYWGNFKYLPESIGQLSALETLILYINKITKLPNSIAALNNLKEIYIQKNQLSELPSDLPDLEAFNFENNPVEKDIKKICEFLQHIIEKKLLEVEQYYKLNPEKWNEIYKDYDNRLWKKEFPLIGFAAFAQYYMLKGAKLNDTHMVCDSMRRFADAIRLNKYLNQAFKEELIFELVRNFLIDHKLKAELFLNDFTKNALTNSKSLEEESKILDKFNMQAWFYLEEGINLRFSLACGQFLSNYGEGKQIPMWECYGKDLIASSYALMGGPERLKEAINIFEEIRQINKEWYSPHMLELAIDKLDKSE